MRSLLLIALLMVFAGLAGAQTSAFTYQGRLTDGGTAAAGTYQMTFALFNQDVPGGTQQGSTITNNSVTVTNGIFTVQLDFSPATPFALGATRWLEISVKKPSDPSFVTLTPRQQITSSPYALRTLNAGAADALSAACVGCVADSDVANGISYSKLSGAPTSLPPSGAAGGDLGGNYPSPTLATGSATGGRVLTALNAATVGTVATARLGSGTANSTTFLRGDGTWTAPTAGGGSQYFNSFNTPVLLTQTFYALVTGGGTNSTTGTPAVVLAQTNLASAMTVDAIRMELVTTTNASGTADTITIQLWKNGSPTGMQIGGTSTIALNTPVFVTSTGGPVTFAAGDLINYTMTHTDSGPIVSCRMTLHAQ